MYTYIHISIYIGGAEILNTISISDIVPINSTTYKYLKKNGIDLNIKKNEKIRINKMNEINSTDNEITDLAALPCFSYDKSEIFMASMIER
jgi:hypothetical protein